MHVLTILDHPNPASFTAAAAGRFMQGAEATVTYTKNQRKSVYSISEHAYHYKNEVKVGQMKS